jgi:hypothetical protein
MHFHLPAIHEINAFYGFPLFEDQFPFLIMERFSIGVDGRQPFGQTSFAQEAAFQITGMINFLHVQSFAFLPA